MNLSDIVNLGMVGCGGAGFPTHVKLAAENIDYLIVNAAECEPLLHKDKEILKNRFEDFYRGLMEALELTNAKQACIGIKSKYDELITLVRSKIKDSRISILPLGDFYPAGDEYELVYEASKRLIPFGGIPLNVGCVVVNVETLMNLGRRLPVTTKILTICGAVLKPVTVEVPIGASVLETLSLAGFTDFKDHAVIDGGPMMGRLMRNPEYEVVTKTCGGLLVLPVTHPLIVKMSRNVIKNRHIARSACDQCTDCSELCPRALLGYPIRPHKAMRTAQLAPFNDQNYSIDSVFCSECGLCSLFACPEDLTPREMAVAAKKFHLAHGVKPSERIGQPVVHPMRSARRVPIDRLLKKLGLSEYDRKAPMQNYSHIFEKVRLPLKMHAGVTAQSIVECGDQVKAGQLIAVIPDKKLGALIHASIDGRIISVADDSIEISRK